MRKLKAKLFRNRLGMRSPEGSKITKLLWAHESPKETNYLHHYGKNTIIETRTNLIYEENTKIIQPISEITNKLHSILQLISEITKNLHKSLQPISEITKKLQN